MTSEIEYLIAALTRRAHAWCSRAFGSDVAWDRKERVARLLEEAVELAQAEGLEADVARKILDRAYSRPVGTIDDELAGVAVTLLVYSYATDNNFITRGLRELARIEALPDNYFRDRLAAKFAAGTSTFGGST